MGLGFVLLLVMCVGCVLLLFWGVGLGCFGGGVFVGVVGGLCC
jgi:hypothetical protein